MKKNKGLQLFIGFVITVVVLFVIIGFFFAGSPQQQRLQRLDQQRVSEFFSIENAITMYWQQENDIPENLSEIQDRFYLDADILDPGTGAQYEYARVSQNEYRVCTTFDVIPTDSSRNYPEIKSSYIERSASYNNHIQGYQCFEITYDRQAYDEIRNDNGLLEPTPIRAY